MKRPLCIGALIITAIVFIYLELFSNELIGKEYESLSGTKADIIGLVSEKEIKPDYDGQPFTVIYVIPTDILKGKFKYIECYLSADGYIPSIGETVLVGGKVKAFSSPTNPGEFDSRLYYSTQKIAYRITDAYVSKSDGRSSFIKEKLFKLRLFLEESLDKCLDYQDSSIMKAMLLGDKAYMDEEVKDLYKMSGIMHILAVSGLHISIIGMGLYKLLKKILLLALDKIPGLHIRSGVVTALPSIAAIIFMYSYGIMCGMGTSSFRAICMFSLRLLAPVFGRTYDVLNSLALAAILLLVDQPLYMYNSGFLFSFGAVIGITVLKPYMKLYNAGYLADSMRFLDDREKEQSKVLMESFLHKLLDGLQTGLAIFVATLPVYALFYYTYPVQSIALNLVVVPLMTILMIAGILAMLLGTLTSFLGIIPGFLVHFILLLYKTISSVETVTRSLTWYMGCSKGWQVAAYIVCLIFFLIISKKFEKMMWELKALKNSALKRRAFLMGMRNRRIMDGCRFLIIVLGIFILTFHKSPDLEINMIDVGQGDGIVISCGGRHMLMDGGSTSRKNVGKYQIIPFLKYKGIGTLDAAVVTHEDQDHISGLLEIFDSMEKGGIRVSKLVLPDISDSSKGENYHRLEERAKELSVPVIYISEGESFNLGEAFFTCLNPEEDMRTDGANAYSTVLFMRYGEFTALFTGDMENEGLENVKEELKNPSSDKEALLSHTVTLLKVAHHGSMYTTDDEFLELTDPRLSVISCGKDNSYGHPHSELLKRLSDAGSQIYRTDKSGAVTVTVNKNKVTVSTYGD